MRAAVWKKQRENMFEGLDAFESSFITSYENRLTTEMAPRNT